MIDRLRPLSPFESIASYQPLALVIMQIQITQQEKVHYGLSLRTLVEKGEIRRLLYKLKRELELSLQVFICSQFTL